MEALMEAAGLRLVGTVRQRRRRADPATFLGAGKLDEVRSVLHSATPPLASLGGPLVVAQGELRPPTLFNLEDEVKAEVWDRIRLILEIFQHNARVKEAHLQVELARLRYELPFVHEALHRRLTGEHAGFMGGGEVEARTYETHLKRRTKKILEELERVKKERRTRREGRSRTGLRSIAIAGYTNSGKSSLLNVLTESTVVAEPRVFSTLQTTTRKVSTRFTGKRKNDLLLTDTVGFIQNLPPWLVDAFSSTLEETTTADAVIICVDTSEPYPVIREKIRTAQEILERIHAPRRRLVLLNKADLVPSMDRKRLVAELREHVLRPNAPIVHASTRTEEGLIESIRILREEILEAREARIRLDLSRPPHLNLESWVRNHLEILDVEDESTQRTLHVRCPESQWGILLHLAQENDAHLDLAPFQEK